MKAVILAAGRGTRFGGNTPKSLLKLDGKTILEHKLIGLRDIGIDDIYVAVGFNRELFPDYGVNYIFNDNYDTASLVTSLYKAIKACGEDNFIVVMDGDLMFNYKNYFLFEPEFQYFVDIYKNVSNDEIGVDVDINGRILSLSKSIDYGVLVGACVYPPEFNRKFVQFCTSNYIRNLEIRDIVNAFASQFIIKPVFVDKDTWVEIDTLDDYDKAKEIFDFPKYELDNNITAKELMSLYGASPNDTGWLHVNRRNLERNETVISNCEWSLVRINGRVVSAVRAFSDGAYNVVIEDWITRPEYRGIGLGSTVLSSLIERYQKERPIKISVIAEPGVESKYEKLGFRLNRGSGMEIRYDYDKFSPNWKG